MKLLLLQFAALSASFVLPNEQVSYLQHVEGQISHAVDSAFGHLPSASEAIETSQNTLKHISDTIEEEFKTTKSDVRDSYLGLASTTNEAIDDAIHSMKEYEQDFEQDISSFHSQMKQRVSATTEKIEDFNAKDFFHPAGHGHHSKPNKTVYQLISENKYTHKLAKLISEYDDLVEILNGTAANYTLFAPTDGAFAHLPKHNKPSKEFIKNLLSYHVSPEYFPVKNILLASTIPTLLKSSNLGKKDLAQRLKTRIGLTGVTLNFNSRVIGVDKFATNGVVHLINSFIEEPHRIAEIVERFPGAFSTFQLGLLKTDLWDSINTTKSNGGTLFLPPNGAFERLGQRANEFLFSKAGLKYLKALLNYHICPKNTLYSDAFYRESASDTEKIPKGRFHADLPTQLEDRSLSIDIARFARLVEITINAYDRVAVSDIVADDGVIQVVDSVLVPPKRIDGEHVEWDGKSELTVEDLMERFEPLVRGDPHVEEL